MALSGLDIYKLLPKTNCRECGFATCLAFAMQLAKKAVSIDKCPHLGPEAKEALEASSRPAIKLISLGQPNNRLEIGNETVMFRHEEKFHHPCGIGFIIEDNLGDEEIRERLMRINNLIFERVGQKLQVNIIAIKQTKEAKRFVEAVRLIVNNTPLAIVLMSDDNTALRKALELLKDKQPLLYRAQEKNLLEISQLAKSYNASVVVSAPDIDSLSRIALELNKLGVTDLILEPTANNISRKIWQLTQIRRQALKKSNRSVGYPTLAVIENGDIWDEALEAATYIDKYAGIILLKQSESWQVLPLLTLRQNIYTDPQKPLQIEPKFYAIGAVNDKSPVLVTTNFSLTYYTVLGEVEASKIPSYILSVNTEGMSVLTAWAAEKFTVEKINLALTNSGSKDLVSHRRLIIPGYVAVMSGELEDVSGWQVLVGPKEAAGIPSFLKNL